MAAATDGRLRAIAEELLTEVALYSEDLQGALRSAQALRKLGDELNDSHFLCIAAVDTSLARAWDDPVGALAELDRTDLPPLSPTDAAWLAYARGDALGLAGDTGAVDAFRAAVELGDSVGSLHVASASRTFVAIEYLRLGDHGSALDAYADALQDQSRHANYTDASTTLRTLVELLSALGDDRGATVLAAATAQYHKDDAVTPLAKRIAKLLDETRSRVGNSRYDAWAQEGSALTVDAALRVATEMVDQYR
jgi:hypothetical protein